MLRAFLFVIFFCRLEIQHFQDGRVVVPLTGLTPSHFCACAKIWPRVSMSYHVVFFSCV